MTFIFWTVWKDPKNVIEHILGPWLTSVFWLFSKKKKSSSCDIDAWNSVNRILGQEKTSTSAGRQLQLMTSHPASCFLNVQWPVETIFCYLKISLQPCRWWCIKFATDKWPLQLTKVHFITISSWFFANYFDIFRKTEVQTVILMNRSES